MTAPLSPPPRADSRALFAALGGALTLAYWRWGYRYGTSDHDEMLPLVLRRLAPDTFSRDPFVAGQDGFSVRWFFVEGVAALAHVIGLEAAVALLTVLAAAGALYGVWMLSRALGGRPLARALAMLGVVLTVTWTLGGNRAISSLLTPESAAWALAVPGVALAVERRLVGAALALGLAAWMHPLVGAHTAALAGVGALAAGRWRDAARLLLGFAVFSAPMAIPLALQQLGEPTSLGSLSVFRLQIELRLPHHHLPSAFGLGSYARFGLLVTGGLAGLFVIRNRLRERSWVLGYLAGVAALLLVGLLGVEALRSLPIAKAQLFKTTVSAQVLLAVLTALGFTVLLPARFADRIENAMGSRWTLGGVVAIAALTTAMAAAGVGRPAVMHHARAHEDSELGRLESRARELLPADALVLVPPSNETFRSRARRAVYVNRKSFPFQAREMEAWLDRINEVAPAPLPRLGLDWTARLDSAYHATADWSALARRTGAEFALVNATHAPSPPQTAPVARAGPWSLYRLEP